MSLFSATKDAKTTHNTPFFGVGEYVAVVDSGQTIKLRKGGFGCVSELTIESATEGSVNKPGTRAKFMATPGDMFDSNVRNFVEAVAGVDFDKMTKEQVEEACETIFPLKASKDYPAKGNKVRVTVVKKKKRDSSDHYDLAVFRPFEQE